MSGTNTQVLSETWERSQAKVDLIFALMRQTRNRTVTTGTALLQQLTTCYCHYHNITSISADQRILLHRVVP
jgi:hypothetical protein